MGSVGSRESKTVFFNNHYDVSDLTDTELQRIAEYLVNSDMSYDYDFFGVRAVEPKYAEALTDSSVWIDGKKTSEKLDGVSALDTRISYRDDVDSVFNKLKTAIQYSKLHYSIDGRKPFILYGNNAEGGNDTDEIVMKNAELLDIRKILKGDK